MQERQLELRQPKADELVWEEKLHIVVADSLSSTYMCAHAQTPYYTDSLLKHHGQLKLLSAAKMGSCA